MGHEKSRYEEVKAVGDDTLIVAVDMDGDESGYCTTQMDGAPKLLS